MAVRDGGLDHCLVGVRSSLGIVLYYYPEFHKLVNEQMASAIAEDSTRAILFARENDPDFFLSMAIEDISAQERGEQAGR